MLFLDDAGGALRQTGLMLNYSYMLKLNQDSKLSMALSGIVNQYSYDGSQIENIDPDPALSMNVSQIAPDMSFGLVYSLKDKLLIGLGINQLIQSKLNKFDEFNNLYTGSQTDWFDTTICLRLTVRPSTIKFSSIHTFC